MRRYNRRYAKRKRYNRRYRKKRYRKKRKISQALKAERKFQAIRRFTEIGRSTGYESKQNMASLFFLPECFERSQLHSILKIPISEDGASKYGNLTELGSYRLTNSQGTVTGMVREVVPYTNAELSDLTAFAAMRDGTPGVKESLVYDFTKMVASYKIRNIDIHPVDIKIWEYVSTKQRMPTVVNQFSRQVCADDVYNGILEKTGGSTTSTSTIIYGDDNVSHPDSVQVASYDPAISPNHSGQFNANWKIVKSKSIRLEPGDEINWRMKPRRYTYRPENFAQSYVTNEQLPATLKGVTGGLIMRVTGMLGRGSAAGEHAKIGFLKADIAIQSRCSFAFYPRCAPKSKGLRVQNTTIDDLTGVTLQSAVEHSLAAQPS